MAPRSRPPNGAVTCQSVPTRPSAVRRAAAWLRRLGACPASAATAASWVTARCAASPNAVNPWATRPICGGSRPAIEAFGTAIYSLPLVLGALLQYGHRKEIGGFGCRGLGLNRPGGAYDRMSSPAPRARPSLARKPNVSPGGSSRPHRRSYHGALLHITSTRRCRRASDGLRTAPRSVRRVPGYDHWVDGENRLDYAKEEIGPRSLASAL